MNFSKEKDPAQEVTLYREKALRAAAHGNEKLAKCWRLAADEAQQIMRQQRVSTILQHQAVPFIHQVALLAYSNQEGHYYLNQQLQKSEASHWAFAKDETREAVSAYRYWITFSHVGTSKNFAEEIQQTTDALLKYSVNVPAASHAAQEAVSYFKKAQETQCNLAHQNAFHHELLIHRWRKAAYAALHLADIHVQGAARAVAKNPFLEHSWNQLIHLLGDALSLRLKAAEATQSNAEEKATHYSLAAFAVSNTANLLLAWIWSMMDGSENVLEQNTVKSFSDIVEKIIFYRLQAIQHETSGATSITLHQPVTAAPSTSSVSMTLKTGSESLKFYAMIAAYWSQAAFWMENAFDAKLYAKETKEKKTEYPLFTLYWKKSYEASEQVAVVFAKLAQAQSLSHILTSFFWKKRSGLFKKRAQKKIPIMLLEKITFCIMQKYLPTYEWRKKWENGEFIQFNGHSQSPTVTSWIYQTCSFLQKAGVDCTLSTEFPYINGHGIYITLVNFLEPSIIPQANMNSLFLVCILADGAPYAGANLHLVENRKYARYLPSSIFVPHWTQPFLKPRDPARGQRFENVCFFGEIQNLAPKLRTKEWSERLSQEFGLCFKIRSPQEWFDYSDIDAVIAIRDFSKAHHIHKPPTKLYNAWLAGVPFIGGSDSAYAADGCPGKNYLVATSEAEILGHLKHLQENSTFRSMLVQNGREAGQSFTQKATLAFWKKLVEETVPIRACQWQQQSTFQRACLFLIQRLICRIHHFYFNLFVPVQQTGTVEVKS